MVERSNGGEIREVEWPREIESNQLQTLLEENRRGAKLRNVVTLQLRLESSYLSTTFGPHPSHPSVDGFESLVAQLRSSVDFVDNGKDATVEGITSELFAQRYDLDTVGKLNLLAEKLDEYRLHAPEIEINEGSELPRHLAEVIRRAEILKRDPRGFALIDYLAEPEQSAYPRDHINFESENLGRKEAAQRYKELYNLLLDNGATPDN